MKIKAPPCWSQLPHFHSTTHSFFLLMKMVVSSLLPPTTTPIILLFQFVPIIKNVSITYLKTMPKEKRRNITGNSTRHAPLGQVIADDENRSKYATVRSRQRNASSVGYDGEGEHGDGEEALLDEKTSQRIFELGKEQLMEIEMEEQKERMRQQTRKGSGNVVRSKTGGDDSSDEEDDMDSSSVLEDLGDGEG